MPLVERRYAQALIDIALSEGMLDAYEQDLDTLAKTYNTSPEFRLFLLDPEVKLEEKKKLLSNSLKDKIQKNIFNFIMLLLDKGRISNLPGISEEYSSIADSKRNTLNMTIISAVPLDEAQIESIKQKYKKLYGANSVEALVTVDKSIKGGIKVKVGDKVTDGSIEGRLKSLRELLLR
jgi:F-type H+-transporting ATPase subunit delta